MKVADSVSIDYTNHTGVRALREIIPRKLWFGATRLHPEPQWFITAFDVKKKAVRFFAMRNIHDWQ